MSSVCLLSALALLQCIGSTTTRIFPSPSSVFPSTGDAPSQFLISSSVITSELSTFRALEYLVSGAPWGNHGTSLCFTCFVSFQNVSLLLFIASFIAPHLFPSVALANSSARAPPLGKPLEGKSKVSTRHVGAAPQIFVERGVGEKWP